MREARSVEQTLAVGIIQLFTAPSNHQENLYCSNDYSLYGKQGGGGCEAVENFIRTNFTFLHGQSVIV